MRRVVAALLAALVGLPLLGTAQEDACSETIDSDCVQEVDDSLTITDTLTLRDGVVLRFTNTTGPRMLNVAGTLDVEDARIEAVEDVDLSIRFQPGSSGRLHNASIDGYQVLEAHAPLLDIDNTTFLALGTALRVEEADVVVRNSSLAAPIAVQAGSNATVKLEGTTWSGGDLRVAPTARLDVSWFVRVVADLSASGGGSANLTVRNATDGNHTALEMQDGQDVLLHLPAEARRGSDSTRLDPYRFILVEGKRATHAETAIGPDTDVLLELPAGEDWADPTWPSSAPLRQEGSRPGFSHNGTVHLAWQAAHDGEAPHHAIDHYRVLVDDDVVVERTRDTRAAVADLPEGPHGFAVEAVDLVGNSASSNTVAVLVDKTPPTIGFAADAQAASAHNGSINITVTATEGGTSPSGLSFLRWRIGDGPTSKVDGNASKLEAEVAFTGPGNHSLIVIAEDLAGNRVEEVHQVVVDTSAPTFLARVEPRLPTGSWHRVQPELHVDVLDPGPSGPGWVQYRVDGGDWQEYEEPTQINATGEHVVQVRVADAVGNEALTQLRVAHDPGAPVLASGVVGKQGSGDWFVGPARVEASATDSVSGLERLEYRIAQGAWRTLDAPLLLASSAEHQVTLRATDAAGNHALSALVVSVDLEAPIPPGVSWLALPGGRVQGSWSGAPPADGVSGVARIVVEREGAGASIPLGAEATGHVMTLANGEHRLRVRVADAAGNEASTSWATVAVHNSTAAADAAKKVRGAVSLHPSTAGDLAEARFFVDGVLLGSTATAPYAVTWQTRGVGDGLHEVRIVAVDEAGLHHEEVRTYHVRNGYAAVLADHPVPAGAALLASAGAVAVASVGFVRWRRWTL